jgi:hypothetical protein
MLFTPQALPPQFGNKIDSLAGPMKLSGSSLILPCPKLNRLASFLLSSWVDASEENQKRIRQSDSSSCQEGNGEAAANQIFTYGGSESSCCSNQAG